MKKLIVSLSLVVLCLSTSIVFSQTSFTGAISGDWAEAGNWDNGLPAMGNDATIPAGSNVLIAGFIFNDGTIFNNGSIINYGTINNDGGTINNYGGITSVDITSDNQAIYDGAYEDGEASVVCADITSDNQEAYDEGAASVCPGDFSGDGNVNVSDLGGFLGAFGTECSASNPQITDAYAEGYADGAASVTPDDGIGQDDLDALSESYAGWCESDIDNDGICDVDEVWGCMGTSACNYNLDAEIDDNSCDYTSCLNCIGTAIVIDVSYDDGPWPTIIVLEGDASYSWILQEGQDQGNFFLYPGISGICIDECGIVNGDNSSCLDCLGVVNGTAEDLGCGCGNPAYIPGYDCEGNEVGVQVGDLHAGGIVFKINEDGTGLVAVADGNTQGAGAYLMSYSTAENMASNFNWQGYDGWYIPSIVELGLMYNTIGPGAQGFLNNIGNFGGSPYEFMEPGSEKDLYCSSSIAFEALYTDRWSINFDSGGQYSVSMANWLGEHTYRFRFIRAF